MTAVRAPKIDATSGDYTVTDGALVEDGTVASEAILILRSKLGSSAIAPWIGTRLHTITKLTPIAPALARIYVREGLKHLVDRGALRKLTVDATIVGTKLEITVAYVDRLGQRRTIPYTYSVTA